MKRFIIISLLSVLSLPMLACAWVDTHNYYLVSAYNITDFQYNVRETCNKNWLAYLGSDKDYYWFNAEEITKAAQQKGDALMVSYVENLQKYLDCVDIEQRKVNEWNYPTAEEIAQCKQTLRAVRTYALGKTKTKLRSQHALLYMRCNMMLGLHQENVNYWEQTAKDFIETVYKDMMKNIYAGALCKTGRLQEGSDLFAEMGDMESLMTLYYEKRSYTAIRQHYQQNPTSKVLPFLLQDFVNNAQEANDLQHEMYGGKLYIRDLTKQEIWQMRNFCELVVREGKTDVPCLWKTAKAWLEYMFGDKKQAVSDILEASKLDGTERMKECARAIMLYMTATQAKEGEAFDDYLADELAWLDGKQNTPNDDGYYYRVRDRLVNQVLRDRYSKSRPVIALSLLTAAGANSSDYMDTMRVAQLEKYLTYINTPAQTALDKYLKNANQQDVTKLEDLIGTKYLRLRQWEKAIEWLEKVPVSFYDKSGYRLYALMRKTTVEPWIKRQWVTDEDAEKARQYNWTVRENQKLEFAKDMQMKEATLNILSGKALAQRYYDLAVRYAQANFTGDCWYLTRDFKSCTDTLRLNEADLALQARKCLEQAAMTSDFNLKEKALFGLGWSELYPNRSRWKYGYWDSEAADWVTKVNRQSPQYRAYQGLMELETQNATRTSEYVSRCDDFIQFKKQFN